MYIHARTQQSLSQAQIIQNTQKNVFSFTPKKMSVPKKSTDINENNRHGNGYETTCLPLIRSQLKNKSAQAFAQGDTAKSIYYDCMALDCGYQLKYPDRIKKQVTTNLIDSAVLQANIQKCGSSESLFDTIETGLSHLKLNKSTKTISNALDIDGSQELMRMCAELPTEWNVLQISIVESPFLAYATRKDYYVRDTQVRLTLLCSDEMDNCDNEPLVIALDLNEAGEKSILSLAYTVYQEMFRNYVAQVERHGYNTFVTQLTQSQTKLLNDMIQWLGPWITLFSGKIRGGDGKTFELDLFGSIECFCADNDIQLNKAQLKLVYLVGRRIDLLTGPYIQQAAKYIGDTGMEIRSVEKILIHLKTKTKFVGFDYNPCILVVDEILDSMPWEMVFPSQEFSRISSFYFLHGLYMKYRANIENGYLRVAITNGCTLINPDNDDKLQQMHERMMGFFRTNLPDWMIIGNRKPSIEELKHMFADYSVFSYSGHASSLQFFEALEIEHIKTDTIKLLFGCESIAMKSEGLSSIADGAPYLLQKMGCPAMLGALTVTTDMWTDLITVYILTQWLIPELNKPIDFNIEDTWTRERAYQIFTNKANNKEPNLLKLLCDIRNEAPLSIRIKAAIIFRGLPVYNVSMMRRV